MAFERQIPAVPPRAFTANGGTHGQVTVADTRGFKVGLQAVIKGNALPDLRVQIKRVLSETSIIVGPIGSSYSKTDYIDLSAYTIAASSYIYADQQEKSKVPPIDRDHATFDQEPTVAWRSVLVDQLGDYYSSNNPMPVFLADGGISIDNVNVQITHLDQPGRTHDSVRIGGEEYEAIVDSNQDLHVVDTQANLKLADIESAVDGLETLIGQTNSLLQLLIDEEDQVEELLTEIRDNTADANTFLNAIASSVDGLETLITASNVLLSDISGYVDGLESLVTSTNSLITTSNSLLTDISGYVDGIESLIINSNTLLSSIEDNTDGIESLIGQSNTELAAINSLITTSNALLTQIRDNADTVEALLTAIGNSTDGLEGLITNSNSYLLSLDTKIDVALSTRASESTLLDVRTALQLIDDIVHAPNASVNKGVPIMGQLDDVGTVLATENNVSIARITEQRALHVNLRDINGAEIGIDTNPLHIIHANKISAGNSTSTPLGSNATFTGPWEDILEKCVITVSIFSSHVSASMGFKFQTSSDGINVDDGDEYTIPVTPAGGAKIYSFGVTARYFRIVYTNGPIAQTAFRLQTILHTGYTKPSSHRVDDAITDEDDAELVKSIITGKTPTFAYKNVAVDEDGRLLISGQSELISPLPSVKLIERRVLTPDGVYSFTHTIAQDTAIKEFTYGGRGPGEGMFGTYVASAESLISGFNSPSEVAQWTSTGTEILLGGTPAYSTAQAFEGTGSVALTFDDSDANHTVEITRVFPTVQSLDNWRYVNAKFYNSPPAGGATTRTISIVLTDTLGNKRFYSFSGSTIAAPFNAAGWINLTGEIRIPTSQTGSTFDINNVASISLRMFDANNKAGTVYWDAVKFIGQLDILQKIYTNGNTIDLNFDPVILLTAGQVIYAALRNNDTVSREFQLTIGGVDVS